MSTVIKKKVSKKQKNGSVKRVHKIEYLEIKISIIVDEILNTNLQVTKVKTYGSFKSEYACSLMLN